MANTIKGRIELKDDVANVRVIISHPMLVERKDPKTGQMLPPHFIEEVTFTHNGETVLNLACGQAVSQNPFIQFYFKGAKAGDVLKASWRDNKGESDSADLRIGA